MTSEAPCAAFVESRQSLSAVSSYPKEEVTLTWVIKNFREAVQLTLEKKKRLIGRLPFRVGGCGSGACAHIQHQQGMPLVWRLIIQDSDDNNNNNNVLLDLVGEKSKKVATDFDPTREWWSRFSAEVLMGDGTVTPCAQIAADLRRVAVPSAVSGWSILKMAEVAEYLDAEGSLTLNIKVLTFLPVGSTAAVSDKLKDDREKALKLDGKCREGVLNGLWSLLGDEKTSDVKIAVIDGKEESGEFLCHWSILSARSPVFRTMFESEQETVEKAEGVVRVEDVSVDAMDQFLTFLYSGRLREKRKEGCDHPTWLDMLADLLFLSDKYDVEDLKEVCDVNFHRAVTDDNRVEMYKLAKRYGLEGAQEKLRDELAKNIDVLLDPL